jgi:hypothetical protein
MCAPDRAGCGQDFAWIVPVCLVEPSLEDGPDPLRQGCEETALPNRRPPVGQASVFLASALESGLSHIQEQALQVCGPPAPLLFSQKEQFVQQMHVTTGMRTRIQEVRSPSIMNPHPGERRQDADSFQCGLTSALMHLIMGQGRCTRHMHPVSLARHLQSRLILMDDLRLDQGCFDPLLHLHQLCGTFLGQLTQGAFAHLDAQQITQHLTKRVTTDFYRDGNLQ